MAGVILLLLGVVFAAAGLSKLASPEPFRSTVLKLFGARAVTPMGLGVPIVELALGSWLVSGAMPRHAAAASVIVLLGFTAVLLRIWRKGLTCGCFGDASESAPSGIARNAVLIALALSVALPEALSSTGDGPWSDGPGMILGRWTVVIGAACAWACVVALVRRRKLIFSVNGV